ncbi:MAG: 50S ribosomal protein L31 [Candidatus Eisenbacteria bacterium]|nr:50S ribosomal protein L31 [bacterium]MBU1700127.1 50S ribosomal protein L31 [Candidatus Eisenbacteria bacterium]
MKSDLHPGYKVITVSCACGESYQTRSTQAGDVLKTEICSKCHPFYTGQQKLVDTAGRVDKYMKKYKKFQA